MSVRALWRKAARALEGGRRLDREAPRPVRSAVLEYGRRRFVKSYRAHVALEFARGEAIRRAAVESGAFRAPAPLSVLEEHDLIVWECLDGLVELREHLMQDVARRPEARAERALLFDAAGRALAAVHASLRALGAEGEHRPFAALRTGDAALDAHVAGCLAASPLSPLHWDFVCGNLFVSEGALVVLDATPNWYLFPPGDTRVASPVYVDGATLAFSLCGHPRFSPVVAGEADGYLRAFVEGYRAAGGGTLDLPTLLACGAEATRRYQAFADSRADAPEDAASARRFRLEAAALLTAAAARALPGGGRRA
jgi:hypothetical protein